MTENASSVLERYADDVGWAIGSTKREKKLRAMFGVFPLRWRVDVDQTESTAMISMLPDEVLDMILAKVVPRTMYGGFDATTIRRVAALMGVNCVFRRRVDAIFISNTRLRRKELFYKISSVLSPTRLAMYSMTHRLQKSMVCTVCYVRTGRVAYSGGGRRTCERCAMVDIRSQRFELHGLTLTDFHHVMTTLHKTVELKRGAIIKLRTMTTTDWYATAKWKNVGEVVKYMRRHPDHIFKDVSRCEHGVQKFLFFAKQLARPWKRY